MSATVLTDRAPTALPHVSTRAAGVLRDRVGAAQAVAFAGVALLALVAPFERLQPLVRLPGQSVSNLEAAVIAAGLAWIAAAAWTRRPIVLFTPLTAPWLVLVGAMACASLAAPDHRVNAFHMTGRAAASLGVFLLAANGVTTRARMLTVAALALAAAIVVGILAVLEYLTVPAVLLWLKAFRVQVMTVGSVVRAGGSLQYPTIASMYLEVVFTIGLGLMVAVRDDGRRVAAGVVFASLLLVAYAITLTFTRSGLISMALAIAIVIALRVREHGGVESGARLVLFLGASVVALLLASRSLDSIWLRFTTEGQESWYGAHIDAPSELTLNTGAVVTVPVTLTNLGRLDWSSDADSPFFLSYHWMLPDEERYLTFDGARTPFAATVSRGERVSMQATVRTPRRPGAYRLVWDVVQERRTWFSDEPGALATISRVTVDGPPVAGPLETFPRPRRPWHPGRLVLWRAALRMAAAHPLLGVGPDNFRLLYPQYADVRGGDPRTHSNNMYLEILAGGGLVTAAAFAWWLRRAAQLCAAGVSRATRARGAMAAAVAAAGIAILVHGLVDSFLEFAPIYVLFSITLGLAAACARGVETAADAHRV